MKQSISHWGMHEVKKAKPEWAAYGGFRVELVNQSYDAQYLHDRPQNLTTTFQSLNWGTHLP